MKKRVLPLLLALVLALSLAPAALAYEGQTASVTRLPVVTQQDTIFTDSSPTVTGGEERVARLEQTFTPAEQYLYGAYIDEAQVYQTLISFRDIYPEGTPWTNGGNIYKLSVPLYDEKEKILYPTATGGGCVAFCYELSDAAFDTPLARNVYDFTYDDIRVGDILRVDNDSHSVTVLEKYDDHVVLAEGNYNASVHWGREMKREQVMKANYVTTRYPAPALTSLEIAVDKATVLPGKTATISIKSPITSTYSLQIWSGDKGSGKLISDDRDIKPHVSLSYRFNGEGIYTIYAEALNSDGRLISGTALISVSTSANSSNAPFTDVPLGAYYIDAVDWAVRNEITNGTGGTNFSPNATVTRGDAVTFLWRAMGKPDPSGPDNNFKDVSSSAYYFKAVQWAAENGITTGISDEAFNPKGTVTRGQMITFLWRTQGKPGETGQGEWYTDAETWANSNSLLTGTAAAYATGADCPRYDVVYYLWNALK